MKQDRTLSIRVPTHVHEHLDQIAQHRWTTISAVVRTGVKREIDAHTKYMQKINKQNNAGKK